MIAALQRILLLLVKDKKGRKMLGGVFLFVLVALLFGFILFNALMMGFAYLSRGEDLYYPLINTSRITQPYDPQRILTIEYEVQFERPLYDKNGKPLIDKGTGLPLTETITETRTKRVKSPHMGVDFIAREGSYVVAACGGVVTQTYESEQEGKTVAIFHEGNGLTTFYKHLNSIVVSQGEEVVLGQPLGQIGMTGDCTDDGEEDVPNLHFEVKGGGGNCMDPQPMLHAWSMYLDIPVAMITDQAGEDWIRWMFSDAPGLVWDGSGFLWPLQGYTALSSDFGNRKDPFTGAMDFHRGLDIPAPEGTPIYAAASGVVSTQAHWSYGTCVKISVSSSMVCIYGHMDARAQGITDGVSVEVGQLIGYVGSTGASSGNHLHFEVNVNGSPVDPKSFF